MGTEVLYPAWFALLTSDSVRSENVGDVMLYNFVTDAMVDVDVTTLTDEEAVAFIPQHPLAQSAYHLLRADDKSVLEALTDIVMVTLLSGGQRKFIHVRDGGRG